jgi:hypothetical protein
MNVDDQNLGVANLTLDLDKELEDYHENSYNSAHLAENEEVESNGADNKSIDTVENPMAESFQNPKGGDPPSVKNGDVTNVSEDEKEIDPLGGTPMEGRVTRSLRRKQNLLNEEKNTPKRIPEQINKKPGDTRKHKGSKKGEDIGNQVKISDIWSSENKKQYSTPENKQVPVHNTDTTRGLRGGDKIEEPKANEDETLSVHETVKKVGQKEDGWIEEDVTSSSTPILGRKAEKKNPTKEKSCPNKKQSNKERILDMLASDSSDEEEPMQMGNLKIPTTQPDHRKLTDMTCHEILEA